MKKSDKEKYIQNFGEESLGKTKIKFFDEFALEWELYAEVSKKIFIKDFKEIFNDLLANFAIENDLKENLSSQLLAYLLQYYHQSLPIYVNQFGRLRDANEKSSYYNFLKSLSKNDINEIRKQIQVSLIPYILSILNIFKSLVSNSNLAEALSENKKLRGQLSPYRKGKGIRKEKMMSYIAITRIIIEEKRSDANAIERYNETQKSRKDKTKIKPSAFSYFKNRNNYYDPVREGILNELSDREIFDQLKP